MDASIAMHMGPPADQRGRIAALRWPAMAYNAGMNPTAARIRRIRALAIALFCGMTLAQALILAASRLSDFQRLNIELAAWEPYVWELSSAVWVMALLPAVLWAIRRFPLSPQDWPRNSLWHVPFSLLFSLAHVGGMVALRTLAYRLAGRSYDFGDWPSELLYEYRKDAWTYALILGSVYLYLQLTRHLLGDARFVGPESETTKAPAMDTLLVRKKGREYLVSLPEVSHIEAGGNYVYLHHKDQVLPMRQTLKKTLESLNPEHFAQTHRGCIVNLKYIDHIEPTDHGDHRLHLTTDQTVPLSRSHREALMQRLVRK